eukprot:bmy_10403T0
MRPTRPSARLPALLLLALVLSPRGTQGRPGGLRGARVAGEEPKPWRSLPAASRSAGPVTFSAECSKHFHRLYHNTRDCSTPACKSTFITDLQKLAFLH